MSISDPEVEFREGTITSSPPGRKASPYRTITDKELTLVQICCDFVCACVALPLSLLLLSQLSAVAVNAPGSALDQPPDRLPLPGGRRDRARPEASTG